MELTSLEVRSQEMKVSRIALASRILSAESQLAKESEEQVELGTRVLTGSTECQGRGHSIACLVGT